MRNPRRPQHHRNGEQININTYGCWYKHWIIQYHPWTHEIRDAVERQWLKEITTMHAQRTVKRVPSDR